MPIYPCRCFSRPLWPWLLGIGFALFPWVSDDLWYRLPFKECFLGDASVEPDEIWRQIYWRHTHDNSRLANALMFAVQFLPAWVHASLSGLAAFGTMRLMQRLGGFGESAAFYGAFSAGSSRLQCLG